MENKTYEKDNLDEIDLIEIFQIILKRKKLILLTIAATTMIAIIYLMIATPWYEAKAFIEIGKYRDHDKEILLEQGNKIAQRLSVKYIDIYENTKGRDSKTVDITPIKKNEDFISITTIGKSNEIATKELQKIVLNLQDEHHKMIDDILKFKQFKINDINRKILDINATQIQQINDQINFLQQNTLINLKKQIDLIKTSKLSYIDKKIIYLQKNAIPLIERKIDYIYKNEIPQIDKEISYISQSQIPTISKTISALKKDVKSYEKELKNNKENFLTIQNNDSSLAALRLAQIQNLKAEISKIKIEILNLQDQQKKLEESDLIILKNKKTLLVKQTITSLKNEQDDLTQRQLPALINEKEIFTKEEIPKLMKDFNQIKNIEIPELKRKKQQLINNDLLKLKEEKKLIELSIEDYNFQNSAIIGKIILDDRPIKPNKLLILTLAFISGLILSAFIIIILEIKKKIE